MNRGNNLGIVVVSVIVCGVLAMALGGSDLIAGWAAGQRAEYAAARAEEADARARLVISQAAAYAIQTDARQTWLIPLVFAGVVFLLLAVIIIQAWRVTMQERAAQRRIAARIAAIEDAAQAIEAVNAGLMRERIAELWPEPLPLLMPQPPEVRGRLVEFERSVVQWGVEGKTGGIFRGGTQ